MREEEEEERSVDSHDSRLLMSFLARPLGCLGKSSRCARLVGNIYYIRFKASIKVPITIDSRHGTGLET